VDRWSNKASKDRHSEREIDLSMGAAERLGLMGLGMGALRDVHECRSVIFDVGLRGEVPRHLRVLVRF